MADTNRPKVRWSSAMSTSTKSNSSVSHITPLIVTRRRLLRPSTSHHQTFAQRMAKTRRDIEELFKLYYSNNIKFDTFQRHMVVGTRIPNAQTSPLIQNPLTHSSTNVFNSKHCVSREQMSPLDLNCNEQQTINAESKQAPIKRTVQVRIDNNPTIIQPTLSLSTSPPPSSPTVVSVASNLTPPENRLSIQQDELHESPLVKSIAFLGDVPADSFEHNNTKTNKVTNDQHSIYSLATIPLAPPAPLSLINNRKDVTILSHSSFSTVNSSQQNRPHIITGTAVTVRQRSSAKPAWHKQRTKPNSASSIHSCVHQPNIKTSPLSLQSDMPEFPAYIGTQRVVSIPSKCSRYVLVTFPQIPVRYNAPTYVERLLLPERFPTLFQNIVHSGEHNQNNK